ncbi:MAG: SusC/RagA family TonB-linked outer membrane protein [Chitinophagaceae bacterium]
MQRLRLLLAMLMLTTCALGQQKTITGTITGGTTKEPLQGVSVQGKNKSVTTDASGKFTIQASVGEIITLSYVEMNALNFTVTNTTQDVTLTMQEGTNDLNAVVVTGYQTQRKVDLTGAVSVVNLEETKNIPAASPMQALQGRVPGLYIETDGSPAGGTRRLLIRGLNTLGNSDPLYVIDGVPTKSSAVFTSLNPNSIASIQILKDASAASIYGARASNGVIIVTTKEGKPKEGQERVSIQLNSSVSVQTEKPWREDVLNAEERGRVLWRAAVNDRTDPSVHRAIYTYDWNGDYGKPILNKVNIVPFVGGDSLQPVGNTDWQDASYERAIINSHDLTISAGTAKSSMLINLAYYKNTGMLAFTNYDRYSARFNSHTSLFNEKLKIGENFQLSRSSEKLQSNDLGGASVPDLAVTLAPTIPVFRKDGAYAGPIGAGYSDRNNPVNMQYVNRWDKTNRFIIFGNVYADLEPVKNLHFRTSFGADYSTTRIKNIDPAFQEGFLGRSVNSLSLNESSILSMTWTNTLSYQIELGVHRLNALAGTEAIREDLESLGAFREGFAVEDEITIT